MAKPKVAFAIACNKYQTHKWWGALAKAYAAASTNPDIEVVGMYLNNTAGPDFNKNNLAHIGLHDIDGNRATLTDANRNDIASQFLQGGADYIYWWDDDTVHPEGALERLLSLKLPFTTGLYYLKTPPFAPVAYFKNDNGTHRNLTNWRHGELVEVDFVGMGCALISREVYEGISNTHSVYLTDNWTGVVVRNQDIHEEPVAWQLADGQVVGGEWHIRHVKPAPPEDLIKSKMYWPYYGMEVIRTEDVWFCELAAHAGYKPTVDTSLNCSHWGDGAITRKHFLQYEFVYQESEGEKADEQATE